MIVDLFLVAAALVFGLLGLRSGAVRQLTHWSGLAGGWLLSGPLAARLTPPAAARLPFPAIAVNVVLGGLLFCAVGAATGFLAHWFLADLAGVVENGRVDRGGGFLLGAGKGAVLIYFFLALLLFFEKPLVSLAGGPPAAVESSRIVGYARAHNLLAAVSLPIASRLERLAKAARDPHAAGALLAQDPGLKALLNDPALKNAFKNDAFLRALKTGDLSALQKDPHLAALLKDPRLTQSR